MMVAFVGGIGRRVGLGAGALLAGAALWASPVKVEAPAVSKVTGNSAPNALGLGLIEIPAVQGSQPLENPAAGIGFYGYFSDGPMLPAPGADQTPGHNVEASKTEPDKNTYLVLEHASGPDANYDYGHHFLFQGHELGEQGYITRVNLDADAKHRVTLFAAEDSLGHPLPVFDGSTWDPWAQRLLFSSEEGADGGIWQATLDFPPLVEDLTGIIGKGGYEGIQNDSAGNLWISEDVSGAKGIVNNHAKQPNSFIYRFVPKNPNDLKQGGKLQVLQVCQLNTLPCQPIVFHAGDADGDIINQNQKDLHTYHNQFTTNWITIHDTEHDGTAPFDANALAKSKLGTPFKRPENAQFRPGTQFTEYYFDTTGDTDRATQAVSSYGGFGAIFKLTQSSPTADTGTLTLFYRGNPTHTAFDNAAFWDENHVVFVEDRGDGLHTAMGFYDSAFRFDVRKDASGPGQPFRIIGLGRDPSATIDSALAANSGTNGFQNEGDNEITGIHISNGDPTTAGILGAQIPTVFQNGWRVFYTQQHGDNVTWEVLPGPNFSE
jgi:hypothetical protein